MEKTDQVLVEETLAGTLESYDVLMRRYERLVYKVAYGFGKNHDAALDISQNTFLRVYDGLGTYRPAHSLKAWLVRIAYNEGINWCRRNRRHQHRREPIESESSLPAVEADQETGLLHRERRARILKDLGRLSEKQRLAVTLRYFQGMQISEVAEVLQCSNGTVKSLLFRGVERLRDSLA